MRRSITLGRIAGVTVGINWSLLVIFALVAAGLALARFPAAHPDAPTWAHWIAGVLTAALFFGSVLAHEVAHAVVARRHGVEVEGITLWLFGGVAQLSGEPPSPQADLRIAGVGPLVSVLIAVLAGAVAAVLAFAGAPGLVVAAAVWLGAINVILAVFNLLPGAPLDGGRLLRSFLWWRHGDRYRAAATAARAGRVLGWLLVGLGLLEFAAGAGGGLWLAFIGWFLASAAGVEEQRADVQHDLGDLTVGEIMTADPVTAPADLTVEELLEGYVFRHRMSSFPLVHDDGRVAGLVTVNRLKEVPKDERHQRAVLDVARTGRDLTTVSPDDEVASVMHLLGDGDRRLLVVEGERVVGILSPTDVVRLLELGAPRPALYEGHDRAA